MKRNILILTAPLLAILLYLLFWPVPIEPVSWTPSPSRGFKDDLAPNTKLADAERLGLKQGSGPEDVALDRQGRLYLSLQEGDILRISPDGSEQNVFAHTGGRPLGLKFDARGDLIVADAYRGLLSISPKGVITELSTSADDIPFRFTNALDISRQGIVYFTDSSYRYSQKEYQEDALEHRPNGRLLSYDPATKTTRLLKGNLIYPNGVALSADESFLLINETWEYRILRHWLKGPRKGETEVFFEGLPAFPDGISRGSDGIFWVALISPRSPVLEKLASRPFLRKIVARLPRFLIPDAVPFAAVMGVNAKGEIVYNLQDPQAKQIRSISSVLERDGTLYLGSLKDRAVGRYSLP